MLSGRTVFNEITFYLLLLGIITIPLSLLTGITSWIINYETKATFTFNLKFALGIILFLFIMGTLILNVTGSEAVFNRPGAYYYLAALMVQLGLALTSDFFGKRIVYS